jgi:hypothetical protein
MPLRPLARLYRLPSRSFFLFGLRGVGKSTRIREQLPEAHRFDLLDEALYQSQLADPALFAEFEHDYDLEALGSLHAAGRGHPQGLPFLRLAG